MYIYKITSPSGKIYIGQTVNFKRRMQKYKSLLCKKQSKLYSSLLKYGFENHKIEIIFEQAELDINLLNAKEKEYYDFYRLNNDML